MALSQAEPRANLNLAVLLFVVTALTLLGVLVVLILVVMNRQRARRRAARGRASDDSLPDAWREAGRRVEP